MAKPTETPKDNTPAVNNTPAPKAVKKGVGKNALR